MSNNDKFIRDTEFGKLMESSNFITCRKCKYNTNLGCITKSNMCVDGDYYFAKDETDENKNLQNLQK